MSSKNIILNTNNKNKVYAVRNIRLCTKDCLCLYVCPTGATDTENSIIDTTKCIGCGKCAASCPSSAISMVPYDLPKAQKKTDDIIKNSLNLINSKVIQSKFEDSISMETDKKGLKDLSLALKKSNKLMAEDIAREMGYMLPQGKNAKLILEKIKEASDLKDKPNKEIEELLNSINFIN